jgi:hypothetical protein
LGIAERLVRCIEDPRVPASVTSTVNGTATFLKDHHVTEGKIASASFCW